MNLDVVFKIEEALKPLANRQDFTVVVKEGVIDIKGNAGKDTTDTRSIEDLIDENLQLRKAYNTLRLELRKKEDNNTTKQKEIKEIREFRGDYYFLSNFYPVFIEVDGNKYSSVEAAYQAMKCRTRKERLQFVGISPVEAKRLGKRIDLRSDWDEKKITVMKKLLEIKFSNKGLRKLLKETGDAVIIHDNYWIDKYWGVYKGRGKDYLGKLLMEIRESIK